MSKSKSKSTFAVSPVAQRHYTVLGGRKASGSKATAKVGIGEGVGFPALGDDPCDSSRRRLGGEDSGHRARRERVADEGRSDINSSEDGRFSQVETDRALG
jgi:hypothetical protein